MSESSHEFVTEIHVRYGDIDTQHVVNNSVYTQFLPESRVGFLEELVDRRIEEVQNIAVGRQEIDYRQALTRDDEVRVTARCTAVGRSSFTLEHEVLSGDDVAAQGKTVLVTIDPATGDSRPIPESLRTELE
jgi:acyl-CoA thioester hydrolase